MKQSEIVLDHLRNKGSITPLDALRLYGIMRLGARIYDLRMKGYDIRSTMETHMNSKGEQKRYATYWINEKIGA